MKKKIFLFVLFLFLLFPFSVSALTYNVNGVDYEVVDAETLRDYCYYTYYNDFTSNHLWVGYNNYNNNNVYFCNLFSDNHYMVDSNNNISYTLHYFINYRTDSYHRQIMFDGTDFSITNDTGIMRSQNDVQTGFSYNNPVIENYYYTDFLAQDGTVFMQGNFTFNDIESKYTINNSSTDIDFPIDKNEFYTLLILVGTLIIMLFLKWCFPFKFGGDLK